MARIPSPEQILLQVHLSLGLDRPESKHISQFTAMGFPLARHRKFMKELTNDIFTALEMDEQARSDACRNMDEWFSFDSALATHTWTHNASQQQVLWHMLAYSYVPGLARRLAFWSLAGAERELPFDAGMPGGRFWFLPDWDQSAGTVRLPVAFVLEWLVDLLGEQSLEHVADGLQREHAERKNMNALRTLQGWRLEGRLPQSAKMIDELFHDEADLDFQGSFHLHESMPEEEQFTTALGFVQLRGLGPEMLADEIPLPASLVQTIMEGKGTPEENRRFVETLAVRYAAPSMRTVRQRLRVARMTQDAYQRLLKLLCGPGANPRSSDPSHNRLLPLLALFHTVYNLTIQSVMHGGTYDDQDRWFESKFTPWDRCDLLLSIMPSAKGMGHQLLGERLTRRFMTLRHDAALPDLVPLAGQDGHSGVIEERVRMLESEADEDARIAALVRAVSGSSAWQALQAEASYLVVSQLARTDGLSPEVRAMAFSRLRELAETPAQEAGTFVIELAGLIDSPGPARPQDVQEQTEALLDGIQKSEGLETWKGPFLRFRARHRLMQNDFEGAAQDFRSALEACLDRNFGPLHGQIAREGFATDIAVRGFDPKIQECYYRHLVLSVRGVQDLASFEDTAVECEEFFWQELYRPYHGVEARRGQSAEELKDLFARSAGLIHEADIDELRAWLLGHVKRLRLARLKDARRDSLLLSWMKQLHHFEQLSRMPVFRAALRPRKQLPSVVVRQAIRILVRLWPEQAKLCDFKGQTPLMIAADSGDEELTGLLAAISDVDAQDHIGRTALHAAVAGGSGGCIRIVLDLNPNVDRVTRDEGQTVLHTAVRFGNLEAVTLIADAFPCRAVSANHAGMTPLDLARDLLDNYEEWKRFMRGHNREIGSRERFKDIISLLETSVA